MNDADRQSSIDDFQNNEDCKLICCSIKAAGFGITLTAASYMLMLELPWNNAACLQVEDRIHRIGTKRNVTIYKAIGKNTYDERMCDIIEEKKEITELATGFSDNIEEHLLNTFINIYTNGQ